MPPRPAPVVVVVLPVLVYRGACAGLDAVAEGAALRFAVAWGLAVGYAVTLGRDAARVAVVFVQTARAECWFVTVSPPTPEDAR